MSNSFWAAIDDTLDRIEAERPETFDGVAAALDNETVRAYSGIFNADQSFFGGSGGDRSLWSALRRAGWVRTWVDADYYYVARHPVSGEVLTYCEGDVIRGDQSVQS